MGQIQVGRTPLRQSIELCGRCNGAQVLVKDESKNTYGTFKDRRCAALLEQYKDRKELVFVQITTGNSGYSMGMMAKEEERLTGKKRKVFNIVPTGMAKAIRKRLDDCSVVVDANLNKDIISSDRQLQMARSTYWYGPRDEKVAWDGWSAENFVAVESYGLRNGYREIIHEIAGQGVKPSYIFCPVGEGELITELAAAAEETWKGGAPKIVGITVKENVLMHAVNFLKNPGKSIADKLVNGYSKFKDLVDHFVKSGRIELRTVGDAAIAREYSWLNDVAGIQAEPSAAAAFCGAVKYDLKSTDTVVIINTGKGIYDASTAEKRWARKLKQRLKYAAVAAGAAAVTAAMGFAWLSDVETVAFRSLHREAELYADTDHNGNVDRAEAREMNWEIPGMDTADCKYVEQLSPRQLEFYVKHKRDEKTYVDIGIKDMIWKRVDSYKDGTFKCEELHPSVPFLYIRDPGGDYQVRLPYLASRSPSWPRR